MQILTGTADGDPRALLAEARRHFESGDLERASGRGWDAFALTMIAAARARDWPHDTHRDIFLAVAGIARETDDRKLLTEIAAATSLRTHFYEGWLTPNWVERSLDDVAMLIEKIESATA